MPLTFAGSFHRDIHYAAALGGQGGCSAPRSPGGRSLAPVKRATLRSGRDRVALRLRCSSVATVVLSSFQLFSNLVMPSRFQLSGDVIEVDTDGRELVRTYPGRRRPGAGPGPLRASRWRGLAVAMMEEDAGALLRRQPP